MRVAGVLATVVAVSMAASAARAADYYLIQGNANQISLIDQSAIAATAEGHSTAPVVAIRRNGQTTNLAFAYAVIPTEFDCAGSRVMNLSMTLYQADGREAERQPAQSSNRDWIPVDPNSQGGAALKFVCAKPEDRRAMAFWMRGADLARIITAVFNGPWPGDVHPEQGSSAPASR